MVINLGLGSLNIPSRQSEAKSNRYKNKVSKISTLPGSYAAGSDSIFVDDETTDCSSTAL